jgi:hypothetical protein
MTNRYDLLIAALNSTDASIVKMFWYALVAVIAYAVLAWTPAWLRRPAQSIYLAMGLIAFVFITVYSWHR